MKCKNCGADIPDNVKFCTFCGTKTGFQPGPEMNNYGMSNGGNMYEMPPEQKKINPGRIAIIALAAVLVIGTVSVLGIKIASSGSKSENYSSNEDTDTAEDTSANESQTASGTPTSTASAPEEIDSSKFDLVANGSVDLTGDVKISTDGTFFLDWGTQKSILLTKSDGTNVMLEGVSTAYLNNKSVSSTLWGQLPYDHPVKCSGALRLDGNRLYMDVEGLTDVNGNELIVESPQQTTAPVQQAPVRQAPVQNVSSQILPQSASRKLTSADVSGLTLQQINYAKNEIYARHGRMFQSRELQNYFNAQSWYVGTIPASQFSESTLSSVERYNADFLANVEFSRAPNGYQLDAY